MFSPVVCDVLSPESAAPNRAPDANALLPEPAFKSWLPENAAASPALPAMVLASREFWPLATPPTKDAAWLPAVNAPVKPREVPPLPTLIALLASPGPPLPPPEVSPTAVLVLFKLLGASGSTRLDPVESTKEVPAPVLDPALPSLLARTFPSRPLTDP